MRFLIEEFSFTFLFSYSNSCYFTYLIPQNILLLIPIYIYFISGNEVAGRDAVLFP